MPVFLDRLVEGLAVLERCTPQHVADGQAKPASSRGAGLHQVPDGAVNAFRRPGMGDSVLELGLDPHQVAHEPAHLRQVEHGVGDIV